VLLLLLAALALGQFLFFDRRFTINERAAKNPHRDTALETAGAWLLALVWILPIAYGYGRRSSERLFRSFRLERAVDGGEFRQGLERGPVRALLPQYFSLGHHDSRRAARAVHARGFRLRAIKLRGPRNRFYPRAAAIDDHADVLIVANYRTMTALGIVDTIPAIGLPYMASAFGIFLLRQTFNRCRANSTRRRGSRARARSRLAKVYVPLAKPVYIAYGLVSVSYHWNNFLWPLIVTIRSARGR